MQHPHVAFTLYDETALALRAVTGAGFREVLAAQQIVTRALGIWGLLLMAEALGLAFAPALLVAAICSLGALIPGPAVLTFEYEPTPRAFAVPLLVCAIGLAAHRRYLAAGVAAAIAFLYHPPTALPFWGVYLVLALWPHGERRARLAGSHPAGRRRGAAVGGGAHAIRVRARRSGSSRGSIPGRNSCSACAPRTSGSPPGRPPPSCIICWCWPFSCAAFVRIRRTAGVELRVLLLGLAALGLLTMPLSWLLLEQFHWGLVPQVQPMRALLFLTLGMQFFTAAAGAFAIAGAPSRRSLRLVRLRLPAAAATVAHRTLRLEPRQPRDRAGRSHSAGRNSLGARGCAGCVLR